MSKRIGSFILVLAMLISMFMIAGITTASAAVPTVTAKRYEFAPLNAYDKQPYSMNNASLSYTKIAPAAPIQTSQYWGSNFSNYVNTASAVDVPNTVERLLVIGENGQTYKQFFSTTAKKGIDGLHPTAEDEIIEDCFEDLSGNRVLFPGAYDSISFFYAINDVTQIAPSAVINLYLYSPVTNANFEYTYNLDGIASGYVTIPVSGLHAWNWGLVDSIGINYFSPPDIGYQPANFMIGDFYVTKNGVNTRINDPSRWTNAQLAQCDMANFCAASLASVSAQEVRSTMTSVPEKVGYIQTPNIGNHTYEMFSSYKHLSNSIHLGSDYLIQNVFSDANGAALNFPADYDTFEFSYDVSNPEKMIDGSVTVYFYQVGGSPDYRYTFSLGTQSSGKLIIPLDQMTNYGTGICDSMGFTFATGKGDYNTGAAFTIGDFKIRKNGIAYSFNDPSHWSDEDLLLVDMNTWNSTAWHTNILDSHVQGGQGNAFTIKRGTPSGANTLNNFTGFGIINRAAYDPYGNQYDAFAGVNMNEYDGIAITYFIDNPYAFTPGTTTLTVGVANLSFPNPNYPSEEPSSFNFSYGAMSTLTAQGGTLFIPKSAFTIANELHNVSGGNAYWGLNWSMVTELTLRMEGLTPNVIADFTFSNISAYRAVDASTLKIAYDAVSAMTNTGYSNTSWNAFTDALADAKEMLYGNPMLTVSPYEVFETTKALNDAFAGLDIAGLITDEYYMRADGKVTGISPNTSLATFLAGFDNDSANLRVMNGLVPIISGIVGTGMRVQYIDGQTVVEEFEIVIFGDVTGDGLLGVSDCISIKRYIVEIDANINLAADVNLSGTVDSIDMVAVKKQILGLETISQYK